MIATKKSPRIYPLEIDNVGDDTYVVMSKGHHDPHEFMRAVRAEGYDWPLGMPTHHWVKIVPTRLDDYNFLYAFVEQGVKGAFPATYAHEAYGKDTYESIVALGLSPEASE